MAIPVSTGELQADVPRGAWAALSAVGRGIRTFFRLALGTTSGRIGLPIVTIHLVVAIFGPLLGPYSATDFHLFPNYPKEHQLTGPSLNRDFLRVANDALRVNVPLVLSSEIQEGLENNVISENLRTQLRDQNVNLSDDATVSTVEEGGSWQIRDLQDTTYSVTKGTERYLLGTDQYGRDVFSRVLAGAGSLVTISLAGALLGIFLGTVVGMGSGYTGGKVDEVVMRVMDGMLAFPGLLLALLILSTLGAKDAPWKWLDTHWESVLIVATVGIVFTPGVARVMRSVTLKAKNLEFVMSARLRGESSVYIIFREILPTTMTVLAVELSVRLSYSILIVSSLGFLGLGVQPPSPDWGLMIGESRQFIASAPWMTLAPAVAVATLVVGVNLLTDGIKQASGLPRDITR